MDGVDLDQLTAWMDREHLGDGPLSNLQLLAGGTQNILLRFDRADANYVLRRPPVNLRPNSNATMGREARVLGALAGSAVPHPRLIAACTDDAVLGATFYLMAPVDGFNPSGTLPSPHDHSPQMRHRIGLSMVEAAAALGNIDYRAAGLGDFGRPEGFLERQVDRWRNQMAGYAEHAGWPGASAIPGVDTIAAWLDRHRPAAAEAGILHGDFHLANVMVRHDSGDLAAVVDWELSTIGDPLLDLGWMLATWPEGDEPRETDVATTPWHDFAGASELVAHYGTVSRRDLSHVDWYVVLACYKLGILLEGTHARACAGKADRATGDMLHAQAVSLFERALRRIA